MVTQFNFNELFDIFYFPLKTSKKRYYTFAPYSYLSAKIPPDVEPRTLQKSWTKNSKLIIVRVCPVKHRSSKNVGPRTSSDIPKTVNTPQKQRVCLNVCLSPINSLILCRNGTSRSKVLLSTSSWSNSGSSSSSEIFSSVTGILSLLFSPYKQTTEVSRSQSDKLLNKFSSLI